MLLFDEFLLSLRYIFSQKMHVNLLFFAFLFVLKKSVINFMRAVFCVDTYLNPAEVKENQSDDVFSDEDASSTTAMSPFLTYCSICRREFRTETSLVLHNMKKHRDLVPQEEKVNCQFCPQALLGRYSLHMI